jgi:hypothetical protein
LDGGEPKKPVPKGPNQEVCNLYISSKPEETKQIGKERYKKGTIKSTP